MAEYKISAKIDADTRKFKSKIQSAINTVKKYQSEAKKSKDVELDAKNERLKRTLRVSKKMLDTFNKTKSTSTLDANADKARRQIKIAKQMLDNYSRTKAKSTLDANSSAARAEVFRYKKILKSIPNKTRTRLVVNNESLSKITTHKAILKSIPNKITTMIDVDTNPLKRAYNYINNANNNFQSQLQSLANMVRVFGTVTSNMIGGALMSSFSALIPIIASLAPVLFAVANAGSVVTGGLVALAGAISIAGAGFVGFGAMAGSAIKMLKDGTLKATKETKNYQSALEGVKDTWTDIIKQNQASIFTALSNSLNAVKVSLQGLTPFLSGVSEGIAKASSKMLDWAKNSGTAQKFFDMMSTTGVSVFNKLLSAAGGFGDGLINVFTQLAPLFQWSASWLDRLGTSFQNWANSATGQNSIKDFMEYVRTNLPIIGNIFKNTFAGIGNLMKSFSGNSTSIFKALEGMTAKFKAWSETVGQSEGFKQFTEYLQNNGPVIMDLIGNIVMLLVNFGTAMAPIASVVLQAVTAIAGFVSELFKAHPAVAQLFGVIITLVGAFRFLVVPVMAIINFLGPLAGVFTNVAARVMPLVSRFGLLKTIMLLGSRAITILSGAFTALSGPIGIIIGVVVGLIAIFVTLWKTNEGFRNACVQAWNIIKTIVTNAITGIITWLQQLLSIVMSTIQPIIPLLQQLGAIVMQVLGVVFTGAIKAVMIVIQMFAAQMKIIWTIVGTIIQTAIQLIVGILTAFIQFITGDFSGAWLTLQQTISNVGQMIWQAIQSIWSTIQSYLFSVFSAIVGKTVSSWSQIWSIISGKLASILSNVVSYFSQVLSNIINYMAQVVSNIISTWDNIVNTIRNALSNAVNAVISGMANILSNIISSMSNIVSAVISGMVRFVDSVRNGLKNAISAARSFISNFKSAGMDMIRGMIDGIGQMAGQLMEAARGVAKKALNAAKSALGIHSPSREFRSLGQYSMLGMIKGIDSGRGSAIRAVNKVAKGMTKTFSPNLSANIPSPNKVSANFRNLNGQLTQQVEHTHNFETSPNKRLLRIEMDLNNDALTSIVNGKNATRHSIFEL